ncbi:hypothetical protein A2774_05040 [Candidatus Roizmanbacteria bacterium RIFCSPHIGHO2_01_FULL_39_12c]|uniref:Endonuclease/exonuclease/phosphatase domain-containing protein n=1 Tax=Candidatus Roizmanbacteria bacterium RIFCSPHIGHO2_01_FULL_39_12c TaxID=1802031 RepID=A0A1F7G963_9BACT|nr:MAG: hypothetical protein A2774_05040 [Candidatus Roizmanbacteria bacterium RIFCSPHIGHO2_01_FULL_39_12c]OGK46500.1 MAG: hypothetical protein A2963_01895 [Candidatus Roizmanbacteria bacterium RIFCSPLOWO2_01_FULL_40_13]
MILRFLHWNILFKEKIDNILSFINYLSPDTICLNELSNGLKFNNKIDTAVYLAQKLHFDHFTKKYMDWKGDESQLVESGIFSYFPIIRKKFHYTKSLSYDKALGIKKGSVYLEAEIKVNRRKLIFATDHLSYTSGLIETKDKFSEVEKLTEILKRNKKNFVFSGDLNAPPTSYTIKKIQNYLVNCGPSLRQKTAFTKESLDPLGWKLDFRWRLDYVFATKDMVVKSAKIVNTFKSDHLPILVEFVV